MKGDSGHVAVATLEPQSSVSVAESHPSIHLSVRPQRDVCPAMRGHSEHTRTHTHSSDWTNGHLASLSEALQDHFNQPAPVFRALLERKGLSRDTQTLGGQKRRAKLLLIRFYCGVNHRHMNIWWTHIIWLSLLYLLHCAAVKTLNVQGDKFFLALRCSIFSDNPRIVS